MTVYAYKYIHVIHTYTYIRTYIHMYITYKREYNIVYTKHILPSYILYMRLKNIIKYYAFILYYTSYTYDIHIIHTTLCQGPDSSTAP